MKWFLFLLAFCFLPQKLVAQDTSFLQKTDPFLSLQWILKDPKGKYITHTQKFLGDDKKTYYYYLPDSFWKDTVRNKELIGEMKSKFLLFLQPYARWAQQVSGIDSVLFLSMAKRESTWGTSERYARSGGELFSIKSKVFQKSCGFTESIKFNDDSKNESFVKLWFGKNQTTWKSFKLFLLTITQNHYIRDLKGGINFFDNPIDSKVKNWKKNNFSKKVTLKYSAEIYMSCLCGKEINNYATDCEGYDTVFKQVRMELKKLKEPKKCKNTTKN